MSSVHNKVSHREVQLIEIENKQKTENIFCKYCGNPVEVLAKATVVLKDMPDNPNTTKKNCYHIHRYRCQSCGRTFTEDIPEKYPGTRVTKRAAQWVKALLKCQMTVKSIQTITGIHWETIRKIHNEIIKESLENFENSLREQKYKPKYLAVDEFAIHKGHRYATCVMDLEKGFVLWVGKGRAKNDFEKFFRDTDMDFLSEVKAVAMDMNASYHLMVEKYLPKADIVYDRYHMMAQYGRDVLGVVRLREALEHKEKARLLKDKLLAEQDPAQKAELRTQMRSELSLYSETKGARWLIISNLKKLNDEGRKSLQNILDNHAKLALCHAMKEQMTLAFYMNDEQESKELWEEWFQAAKSSGILALKHFAELKEKRLPGLIAHAKHRISTGPLEGLNNKIKVAKRIAYGYRNEDYFFSFIRFLTIPSSQISR